FNTTSFPGALHARSACIKICIILEKIQVPPRFLSEVVYRNLIPTNWAGESSSTSKVDIYVEPFALLGKNNAHHLPWGIDAKGKSKKCFWLHDKNLQILK